MITKVVIIIILSKLDALFNKVFVGGNFKKNASFSKTYKNVN